MDDIYKAQIVEYPEIFPIKREISISDTENETIKNVALSHLTKMISSFNDSSELVQDIEGMDTKGIESKMEEFQINKVIGFPNELKEAYDRSNNFIRCGVLKEIEVIYFIFKDNLFLWDYNNRELIDISLPINNVFNLHLCKPKKGCFDINVEWILVVCSSEWIQLFSLFYNNDNKIELSGSPYNIRHNNLIHDIIQSTEEGRIFIASENETLYEIHYKPQSILFTPLCSITKFNSNWFSKWLPQIIYHPQLSNFIDLKVDHQRHLLYALKQDSTIVVISLLNNKFEFKSEFNNKNNNTNPLPFSSIFNIKSDIISLHIVPTHHSNKIILTGITKLNETVLFTSMKIGAKVNDIQLKVYNILEGPISSNSPSNTYYNNGLTISSYNQNDNNTKMLIRYIETINIDNIERKVNLFNQFELKGKILDLYEVKIKDKQRIVNNEQNNYNVDDLNNQYYNSNRKFIIITSIGLFKINKLRPIDQLLKILLKYHYNNIQLNLYLNNFINLYGNQHTIAMLLLLYSNYPLSLTSIAPEGYNIFDLNQNPNLRNELIDIYLECCKLINNQPIAINKNDYRISMDKYNFNLNDTVCIKNSNAYFGLLIVISKLLKPIFNTPFIKLKENVDKSINVSFGNTKSTLDYLNYNLANIILNINKIPMFNSAYILKIQNGKSSLNKDSLIPAYAEIELIKQMYKLVSKIQQVVNLFQILYDYKALKLIHQLPKDTLIQFSNIHFEHLLDLDKYKPFFNHLVSALIKELIVNGESADNLLNSIERFCLSIFDDDAIVYLKGIENLVLARAQQDLEERTKYVFKAQAYFDSIKTKLSIYKIEAIVQDYNELGFSTGALKLITNFLILEIKQQNNNLILEKQKYNDMIHSTLDHLLPIIKQNYAVNNYTSEYIMIQQSIKHLFEVCNIDLIHFSILDWFNKHNLLNMTFEFPSNFFELYFKSKANLEPEVFMKYLCFHKKFFSAARIYFDLASQPSYNLTIDQRVYYLEKALECTNAYNAIDIPGDKIRIQSDIEYVLITAKIQKIMKQELVNLNTQLALETTKKMDFKVYDVKELKLDFLTHFNLPQTNVLMVELFFRDEFNQQQINNLWFKFVESVYSRTSKDQFSSVIQQELINMIQIGTKSKLGFNIDSVYNILKFISDIEFVNLDTNVIPNVLIEAGFQPIQIIDTLEVEACKMDATLISHLEQIIEQIQFVIDYMVNRYVLQNYAQKIQVVIKHILAVHPHLKQKIDSLNLPKNMNVKQWDANLNGFTKRQRL